MIKIYFDNTLVNSDYYVSLNESNILFNDNFRLGCVPSDTLKLKVPSSIPVPSKVKIMLDNDDYGYYIVDKYEYRDNNILELNLCDDLVLTEKNYNAQTIVESTTNCTTKDILEDICDTFDIEVDLTSFDINEDVPVNYWDNTITGREYLSYLSEINGGFAQKCKDGKLRFRRFTDLVPSELYVEDCENFKLGQRHEIERVIFDNGENKWCYPQNLIDDDSKETLYLNPENVYITSQTVVDNIGTELVGFEYYNFSTGNCPIDTTIQAGNPIKFINGNDEYISIAQYNIDYNGAWIGGYELNLQSQIQEETQVRGEADAIKSLKIIVNRETNTIGRIATKVEGGTWDGEEYVGLEQQMSTTIQNEGLIASQVSDLKNGYFGYHLTTDTTFTLGDTYYYAQNNNYYPLEWNPLTQTWSDPYGNTYSPGDSIPTGTIYERDTELTIGVDALRTQLSELATSISTQTEDAVTNWFATEQAQSSIIDLVNGTLSIDEFQQQLDAISQYVRNALDLTPPTLTTDTVYKINKRYFTLVNDEWNELIPGTDYIIGQQILGNVYESAHYNRSYTELGGAENPNKIRIYPDEIIFYTNGTVTAYLKNNALYIEESTILKRERVGHWETSEDENYNLNTRWVGDN